MSIGLLDLCSDLCFQVPVYIAEIAPQTMRGALGSVNQVSFGFLNFLFF